MPTFFKQRNKHSKNEVANPDHSPQSSLEETRVLDKKSSKWGQLGNTIKKISNKVEFGPITEAVLGIKNILEQVEGVTNGHQEYEMLLNELNGLAQIIHDFLDSSLPLQVTTSMKNISDSNKREVVAVEKILNKGPSERFLARAEVDFDSVLKHYRQLEGHVYRLSLNANLSTAALVQEQMKASNSLIFMSSTHAIRYTLQETRLDRMNTLLDRLNPAHSARYDSTKASDLNRGQCTPGTRVKVLDDMLKWVHNQQTESVYWTNGMAGTGKTTISYSLCTKLESSHLLAASFFCTRSLLDCKDVNRIIPSIAYQIAQFSDPYCYELFQVLQNNRDIAHRLLESQFEALISNPLLQPNVQETLPSVMVVVIDALDECEDKTSTGKILRLLLSDEYNLPIKFFIFSRPEVEIREQMAKQQNIQNNRLILHELEKAVVQSDIRTYLGDAFSDVKSRLNKSQANILDQQIEILVQRSGELFIYAATAVRYISHSNFTQDRLRRFQQVLTASSSDEVASQRDLDNLYSMILKQAFDDPGLCSEDRRVMKLVLDTVICAQEPITIGELTDILQLQPPERVRSALQPLWSVLHVTGMEMSELVATFHASFPDFMLDSKRSNDYHCRATQLHDLLAQSCFSCIQRVTPGFNICGLESSFKADDEIPDLVVRVRDAIPSLLFYSCRYWSAHLSLSSRPTNLINDLEVFLSCKLLLWMEVLNLKKAMNIGVDIIQRAVECCLNRSDKLLDLAQDAARFVTSFAAAPVSESTPHIYISMLPFWPHSAPLSKCYRPRILGMVKIEGKSVLARRTKPLLLAEWRLQGAANTAAISPDGKSLAIAVASNIHIIDSSTGREVLKPMCGHTDKITSIDFSPDGASIVSGSIDKTVRLWDVHSGREITTQLMEHKKSVLSVAFSPVNNIIASGSADCTVRIWDISRAGQLIGTLEGHSLSVGAVKFSPDGTSIVSGSDDWSMRVWDTQTGNQRLGPPSKLKDFPNQPILEFPVSPDFRTELNRDLRSYKINGFVKTERYKLLEQPVLPAKHEELLVELAQEKQLSNTIYSVDFSPDGSYIASGCRDGTLRLWGSAKGNQVCSLLAAGSLSSVICAKFTPDGTRIISGAADGTVCVWSVETKKLVLGPLSVHRAMVTWVGCSHDSVRAFSVSADKTIRIWDLQSKPAPVDPVIRSGRVTASCFSLDGFKYVSGDADSNVRLWDTRSCRSTASRRNVWYTRGQPHLARETRMEIHAVAISPDGKRIAYEGGGLLRLWDLQRNRLIDISKASDLNHLVFSHSGQRIAIANPRGIQILHGTSGRPNATITTASGVNTLAYSLSDSLLATGLEDGQVVVLSMRVGSFPLYLGRHEGQVTSIAVSRNGLHLVSGSRDKTLRVWHIEGGEIPFGPIRGHIGPINSVNFSPDGNYIVSASMDEGIHLWDVESRARIIGPLSWHTKSIHSVSFFPDSTRIVSGTSDGSILVWDTQILKYLDEGGSHVPRSTWNMREDGWITDEESRLLIWIPHDLRTVVLPVHAAPANDLNLRIRLDFESAYIGESWLKCHHTESTISVYDTSLWEQGRSYFESWCRYLTNTP
ncbi:unnamed protein product [Rhizoctonia solani]|uniref:Nephrocystin 3-like N-terminal domain-containing protein n=1 Tax=Rhizoctonia solani TaxID=456999 RepID=A0A8H3AEZ7_9AGAM|nr:unnamed protein product [Rhizoctonia solani]